MFIHCHPISGRYTRRSPTERQAKNEFRDSSAEIPKAICESSEEMLPVFKWSRLHCNDKMLVMWPRLGSVIYLMPSGPNEC